MLITLLAIVDYLLWIVLWIIIIQAVLSWLVHFNVVNRHSDFVRQLDDGLSRMTEPLYRPIRRVMPDFGLLDFSPLVVLLVIQILRSVVIPAVAMHATGI
ncbi:MAG TPA: YggT family protein [Sphingomonas sp.]|nr:YggT family protein [Sphingomonas sp.]